jgi:hypothetical protein
MLAPDQLQNPPSRCGETPLATPAEALGPMYGVGDAILVIVLRIDKKPAGLFLHNKFLAHS